MNIKLYDKENCSKCLFTEMKLKSMGIPFETADIFEPENAEVLEWARDTGHNAMPLVFIDGEFAWNDLRMDKLEEL